MCSFTSRIGTSACLRSSSLSRSSGWSWRNSSLIRARVFDHIFGPSAMNALSEGCENTPSSPKAKRPSCSSSQRSST